MKYAKYEKEQVLNKVGKELSRRITNYSELSTNQEFNEWLETMFSCGLLGLDFIDVYGILENKTAKISKVVAKDINELKPILEEKIDKACKGILIAIRAPESFTLEEIHRIEEIIVSWVNVDCKVLQQAMVNDKNEFEIFLLTI